MNFLAHAHLSPPDPAWLLGSLLADFVKGPLHDAPYPASVRAAMRLHRAVDEFVDTHPGWLATKRLLSPARRRFACVLVDMFYDHCLAADWAHYDARPLPAFAQEVYAAIRAPGCVLPPDGAWVLRRMADQDWLSSYARIESIGHALERMAQRSPRVAALRGAEAELRAAAPAIHANFRVFYPQLQHFVRDRLDAQQRGLVPPRGGV